MGLFNFFNRENTSIKEVSETIKETNISIIDKIHSEFYSEVNILLNEAKQFNEIKNRKPELVDKYNRLFKLGFKDTPEMIEAKAEIDRMNILEKENSEKKELIEAINYFSINYPEYKFITEESVVNICNKYGLVYSEVENFRGNVPFENLEQMEKFKIKDEDKLCLKIWHPGSLRLPKDIYNITYSIYEMCKHNKSFYWSDYEYKIAPLEICAPLNQFNITDLELQGKKLVKKQIEIKDPIVLQPVIHENKKHYLIVTAWGQESHDSEVINNKMN